MKTIRIIGGGLAGLSLGVCLRKMGVSVEIHEKGSYPRHKVCGEFISGISKETLAILGIDELFSDALQHHNMHWWMGCECLLTETLPEPATGISRYTLDELIAEKFERLGGKLTLGKRVPIDQGNEEGCVWATGKPISKNQSHPEWIGLKIHAVNATLDGLHMHSSTSRGKGGYVGLAGIENSRVNCCGLFHVRDDIRPSDAR
ncbi:MAG: NAD(P)/FAD-dependent oxidoreductase, partial [Akkermansiaceae bacterium]